MDSRDVTPDFIPEDLSINDIESISEFVVEVVFGADNAFAEHDERDGDTGNASDLLKTFICHTYSVTAPRAHSCYSFEKHIVRDTQKLCEHIEEIQSPPPQPAHIS